MTDVEKTFLQIGIQENEHDVTRFLWLRDVSCGVNNSNVVVYHFCRVLFGLICSAFLLGATLKFHLRKEDSPLTLNILKNMYVDNVLIGTDSVEEACVFGEAKDIFKRAAMNLRQWNSNSVECLESLSMGERDNHGSGIVRVLGMVWDRINDVI